MVSRRHADALSAAKSDNRPLDCFWKESEMSTRISILALILSLLITPAMVHAEEGDWEITAKSELAVQRGLDWLAKNQGEAGNWGSNDLGPLSGRPGCF